MAVDGFSVISTPTPGASEGNQHLESMTANESGMTSGATSSALTHILEVDCISGSDEYQVCPWDQQAQLIPVFLFLTGRKKKLIDSFLKIPVSTCWKPIYF